MYSHEGVIYFIHGTSDIYNVYIEYLLVAGSFRQPQRQLLPYHGCKQDPKLHGNCVSVEPHFHILSLGRHQFCTAGEMGKHS